MQPRTEWLAKDPYSSIGPRLGRVFYEATADVAYAHTSLTAGWEGAVLTHLKTGAHGKFRGCWSSVRLSTSIMQGASNIPGASQRPAGATLLIGIPGETYSGVWRQQGESLNLFLDLDCFEKFGEARVSEQTLAELSRMVTRDDLIEHLQQALFIDVLAGSPNGPVLGETIIAAILARLLSIGPAGEGRHDGALSRDRLRRLDLFIEANLGRTLHLRELAAECGLSVRHFCRTLKAATGSSPHQYVLRRRVEHARLLIISNGHSLDEVAESTGFADRSHMWKVFQAVLKTSPSFFRPGMTMDSLRRSSPISSAIPSRSLRRKGTGS